MHDETGEISKRDLPRIVPSSVQLTVTLLPMHRQWLDELCATEGGITLSEMIRILIRDRVKDTSR